LQPPCRSAPARGVGASAEPSLATPSWQWYKADFHVPSVVSADAFPDLGIISSSAKANGFNAIFLTDHNLGSNFPISSMTANHMFFEDTYRRWTTATTGSLSSSTNQLVTSPVASGTSSLHLASTSSTDGETFVWTKRGPNFRTGTSDAILTFKIYPSELDAGSGLYVSAAIGGDPTVWNPANNPVGYTTTAAAVSPESRRCSSSTSAARRPPRSTVGARPFVRPRLRRLLRQALPA
jgi:hypothetical protein